MITTLVDKPKCFKDIMNHRLIKYYKLTYKGEVYGWGCLDFRFKPWCMLHLEIDKEKWSKGTYKELVKKDWIFAKNIIRALGCERVTLTKRGVPEDQKSYAKLIKKCGFPEPVTFTQSIQEI